MGYHALICNESSLSKIPNFSVLCPSFGDLVGADRYVQRDWQGGEGRDWKNFGKNGYETIHISSTSWIFGLRDSRCKIRDSGFNLRSESEIRDARCEIRDSRCEIRDLRSAGVEIRIARVEYRDSRPEFRESRFEMRDQKFEIRIWRCELRDLKFGAWDPRFEMRDSRFAIRDLGYLRFEMRFIYEYEFMDEYWYWIHDGKSKKLSYMYDNRFNKILYI